LVATTKEVKARPQTTYSLTKKGKAAFSEYLQVLEGIIKLGKK